MKRYDLFDFILYLLHGKYEIIYALQYRII